MQEVDNLYYSISNFTISHNELDSYNEMEEFLNKCEDGHLIIGDDAECFYSFYVIEIFTAPNYKNRFGIGVVSGCNGLKPCILPFNNEGLLIIGNNREVNFFNLYKLKNIKKIEIGDLFLNFLYIKEQKSILIISETGIMAIDSEFKTIWKYYQDVIIDYKLDQGQIILEFMDSPSVSLSLIDGSSL